MIAEARQALAGLLADANVQVYAVVPDRATVPCAIVEPSSTWIESGDTFGSFNINFDVTLAVQTGSNEKMTTDLDALVEAVIISITDAQGFYVASVDQPTGVNINDVQYLGLTLTVKQITKL